MVKINLLNHQGLSFEAFKTWLNQLITDKKGALPDLNDWKLIKEKLDKVTVTKNKPTTWVDRSHTDDDEYFDDEHDISIEQLREWAEMDMDLTADINYLMDLSESIMGWRGCEEYHDMPITEMYYNGHPVDLGKLYDERKESENDANSICEGI